MKEDAKDGLKLAQFPEAARRDRQVPGSVAPAFNRDVSAQEVIAYHRRPLMGKRRSIVWSICIPCRIVVQSTMISALCSSFMRADPIG